MTSIQKRLTLRNCKFCNSKKETTANGFVVCTNCGTTKDRSFVDHLPVKTDVNNNIISHNSVGKNIGYIGGLGSEIGYKGRITRSSRGKPLKSKTIFKYRRLTKFYHDRAKIEGNATHLRTMVAFNRIVTQLEIPLSLKQRALFLYWEQVKKENRITNHILLIALCLLVAVREAKDRAPIRFSEIVNAFADNQHRVTNKNILRLARELGISLAPVRRKAEDYIERIASAIKWDQEVKERLQYRSISSGEYELVLVKTARRFLELVTRRERGGVQPYPFAVSILYLSDRAYAKTIKRRPILTQKILAGAADSAEFTIRDHVYRFLGDIYKDREPTLVKFINSIL